MFRIKTDIRRYDCKSHEKVERLIRNWVVRPTDLIYDESSGEWRPIGEHDRFASTFAEMADRQDDVEETVVVDESEETEEASSDAPAPATAPAGDESSVQPAPEEAADEHDGGAEAASAEAEPDASQIRDGPESDAPQQQEVAGSSVRSGRPTGGPSSVGELDGPGTGGDAPSATGEGRHDLPEEFFATEEMADPPVSEAEMEPPTDGEGRAAVGEEESEPRDLAEFETREDEAPEGPGEAADGSASPVESDEAVAAETAPPTVDGAYPPPDSEMASGETAPPAESDAPTAPEGGAGALDESGASAEPDAPSALDEEADPVGGESSDVEVELGPRAEAVGDEQMPEGEFEEESGDYREVEAALQANAREKAPAHTDDAEWDEILQDLRETDELSKQEIEEIKETRDEISIGRDEGDDQPPDEEIAEEIEEYVSEGYSLELPVDTGPSAREIQLGLRPTDATEAEKNAVFPHPEPKREGEVERRTFRLEPPTEASDDEDRRVIAALVASIVVLLVAIGLVVF